MYNSFLLSVLLTGSWGWPTRWMQSLIVVAIATESTLLRGTPILQRIKPIAPCAGWTFAQSRGRVQ